PLVPTGARGSARLRGRSLQPRLRARASRRRRRGAAALDALSRARSRQPLGRDRPGVGERRRDVSRLRVLLVGSGGREHALAWKLARSPRLGTLYAAPGNPGIAKLAECVPVRADDVAGIADLAERERIDLTVVGPEGPLALGVVDALEARGRPAFGPTRAAAALEGSKAVAQGPFMR